MIHVEKKQEIYNIQIVGIPKGKVLNDNRTNIQK